MITKLLIAKYGIGYGICISAAMLFAILIASYTAWEYREESTRWVCKQCVRWSAWYAVVSNDEELKCPEWADYKLWKESLK